MRPLWSVLVLGLLVNGCGTGQDIGRPLDHGTFIDARLLPDGSAGLVTFHRELRIPDEYQPSGITFLGSAGKPLPDGLASDRYYVGVYHLPTSTFEVLASRDNTDRLRNQGQLHIADVEGHTALITESGQLRDYSQGRANYFILYQHEGRLIPVPIYEELAQRGLALRALDLVNGDGVLVVQMTEVFNGVQGAGPMHVAVRYPSGEYVQLSESARYWEIWQFGDEVFYELSSDFSIRMFNVRTRLWRNVRDRPSVRVNPPRSMRVHSDGTVRLFTPNESAPETLSEPLPIDTAVMK